MGHERTPPINPSESLSSSTTVGFEKKRNLYNSGYIMLHAESEKNIAAIGLDESYFFLQLHAAE